MALLAALLMSVTWTILTVEQKDTQPLTAPTYYIAVSVQECHVDLIRVRGASNLPPGSIIRLLAGEPVGDFALAAYSLPGTATVDADGFFVAELRPAFKKVFRRRLIVTASFRPDVPPQPKSVLDIVGRKGQRLGPDRNPQLGHFSGDFQGLDTIAGVGVCFR